MRAELETQLRQLIDKQEIYEPHKTFLRGA